MLRKVPSLDCLIAASCRFAIDELNRASNLGSGSKLSTIAANNPKGWEYDSISFFKTSTGSSPSTLCWHVSEHIGAAMLFVVTMKYVMFNRSSLVFAKHPSKWCDCFENIKKKRLFHCFVIKRAISISTMWIYLRFFPWDWHPVFVFFPSRVQGAIENITRNAVRIIAFVSVAIPFFITPLLNGLRWNLCFAHHSSPYSIGE